MFFVAWIAVSALLWVIWAPLGIFALGVLVVALFSRPDRKEREYEIRARLQTLGNMEARSDAEERAIRDEMRTLSRRL